MILSLTLGFIIGLFAGFFLYDHNKDKIEGLKLIVKYQLLKKR